MKTAQFVTLMARRIAERLTLLVEVIPLGKVRGEDYFELRNSEYELFGWFRTLKSNRRVFQVNRYDIRNHCQVNP